MNNKIAFLAAAGLIAAGAANADPAAGNNTEPEQTWETEVNFHDDSRYANLSTQELERLKNGLPINVSTALSTTAAADGGNIGINVETDVSVERLCNEYEYRYELAWHIDPSENVTVSWESLESLDAENIQRESISRIDDNETEMTGVRVTFRSSAFPEYTQQSHIKVELNSGGGPETLLTFKESSFIPYW